MPNPKHQKKSGFALVIALALMAFVVLLLLSIATFVRVETEATQNTMNQAKAKQNALLGLMIAVGELQQSAGPDQRITATNDLRPDARNGTQQITGVWSSEDLDGDGRPDGTFLRWLISMRDPLNKENADFFTLGELPIEVTTNQNEQVYRATDTDFRLLLGGGSLQNTPGIPDEPAESERISGVVAQTIPTGNGNFAWWVGDEGVKANLALRYAADTSASLPIQNLSARRSGLEPVEPGIGTPENYERFGRSLGLSDLDFTLAELGVDRDHRELFEDFTIHSIGVLSDVRNGGLRKNLSAAFLEDAEFDKLLADAGQGPEDDLVFGPLDPSVPLADDPGGPRWEQLRSYFRQGQLVNGNSISMVAPTSDDSVSAVTPIIAQAQLFVYAFYLADDASNPDAREVVYFFMPAIVLWNPYDVEIDAPELYTRFWRRDSSSPNVNRIRGFQWGFAVENTSIGDFSVVSGNRQRMTSTSNFARVALGDTPLTFAIPATRFPPGEAIIFSPETNQPFTSSTGTPNNRLVRGWNPDFGFYFRTGRTFTVDETQSYDIRLSGDQTANGFWELVAEDPRFLNDSVNVLQRHANVSIFGMLGSNPDTSNNLQARPPYTPAAFSEIQPNLAITQWTGPNPNLVRFPAYGYKISLRLNENATDDFFPRKRVQWLGQHNPRAPLTSNTPLETLSFAGSNRGLREHPSFSGAFTEQTLWKEIQETAAFSGANIGHADTLSGNQRAILYELPRSNTPFVSLVQLGMTNFARTYDWDGFPNLTDNRYIHDNSQQAFPLGNSIPDGRVPANRAGIRWAEHPNVTSNANNVLGTRHDVSFRLNEALFDRFFFSSEIVGGLPSENQTIQLPLNNSRLLPANPDAATYALLRDYDTTAENFVVDGAFNINSTSVAAWAAVIGAFFNNDTLIRTPDGSESAESGPGFNPLSRFFRPTGSAVNAASASVRADANYVGYRRLDRDEVQTLAEEIVDSIRRRRADGVPFLSLADFVNRDIQAQEMEFRRRGVLQEAIDRSGINQHLEGENNRVSMDSEFIQSYPDGLMEGSLSTGVPGFLMQSDLLLKLSPILSARSDTFRVRAYGSAQNALGRATGEAWCEAIVQRLPEVVDEGADGRRFIILSFRWLDPSDV